VSKKRIVQGIGESKAFNDLNAPEVDPRLKHCHVGGMPVENLPDDVKVRLFYRQTDEGIAEANEGKADSAARVSQDQLGKQIQERRDFLENNIPMEPWEAPDPLKAVADAHAKPGMRPKFLSERRLNKEGNFTRGFEVCMDASGDPVKMGTLVLAHMPEEMAERRNETYRRKSDAHLAEVYQNAQGAGVRPEEQLEKQGQTRRGREAPEMSEESYFPVDSAR